MEDERKQKKLEAAKEKLAAYQDMKKKNLSSHQSEQKKKKRVENEAEETSIGEDSLPSSLENSERIELDVSARSNGASFVLEEGKFGSEDAGELSTDRLQSRVKELEDILSGKEAALEAAHEELSALKEISSLDVSSGMLESDYKIHLEEYHKRLQGFQEAVQDRERIIGQLSTSLQQAIKTRDALQLQGEHLAQEVALLQRQLKATTESIQSHQWDTGIQPHDYLALQNQMLALEAAVSKNESTIDDLRNVIKAKDSQLQGKSEELEKKTQELSHHKTKSANEIQKLMRDVEELHQKCAMQSSNHNSLLLEHQEEMSSLQSQLEENFGLQLVQIKEELRNQFSLEKQSMKENHAAEINSCQALIAKLTASSSKADAEVTSIDLEQLQVELEETSESKLLLEKQIEQLKESYDSEVFSLKENITRLQTVLEESEKVKQNLGQQVVDTEKKYEKEFTSHKEQVEDLNFKLQEARKAETSYFTQLRECEAELASCQQSHEMELASCRQRVEALNQRLQEASEAEENFPKVLAAHKQSLESELSRHKEEIVALKTALDSLKSSNEILQKEKTELLDSHGIVISSYEQQLLALKTSLHTSESFESEFSRYKEEYNALNSELQTLKSSQEISEKEKDHLIETHNSAIASYEQQILILRKSLQTAEETVESHRNELADLKYQLEENNKNIEAYINEVGIYKEQVSVLSSHLEKALKVGESLQQEFSQCKENQGKEISLLTQKFELELNARASNASQSQETELALCKQQIEFLNSRLQDSNDAEKCHVSEITACQVQLKEYKNQVESLDRRFNEELLRAQENFSKELSVKDQEIEVLKVQLREASKLEEVHKSDFSYKSQVESLNRQLLKRDETEKRYVEEVKSYQEKLILYTDQINHFKSFADSQNELQIYKEQMETMKESFQCELSKLTSLHEAEMKAAQERHEMETQSLKNQLEIFNQQLADILQLVESIEEEKETYSEEHLSEISLCDHRIEKMKSKLQQFRKLKDIYEADILRSKEQLTSQEAISHSLNAELAKLANEVLREKETHAKEISDLKEAVEQVKNDKIRVETNLNDVIKQRDEFGDSNRAQLEEVMVQYLKLQSLLTAKEEVENSLENQIKDLQVELRGANDQAKTENSNFQEITVQYLKLEGLLSAKEETLQMLAERNRYLEETMATVSKNSEDCNKECSQLTQKIAKAKELLRRLKAEKDVVSEKCEQLEMDKEQLISEKAQNEEKLKELTYQIEHMKTHTKTDDFANKTDLIPSKETSVAKVVAQLEGSVTTVPGSNFCNENTVITIEDINDAEPHIPESGPLKRRKRDVTDSNAPCQSSLPHKWVEKLITLEDEKIKLENNLVMVESKLQEKEAVEQMYKEDKEKALAYCRELEERLQELGGVKVELSTAQHIKQELELKITNLTNEIRTFQMKQDNLNQESMEEKFHREDKTHQELKEKFDNIRDEQNNGSCEQLILDLSKTAKEVVFLKEKLRIQEQSNQTLCSKVLELEKSKEMSEKKVASCYSELTRVHAELEESWRKLHCSKEELGTVKKEITILQLQKERLEASRNKWNGQDDITPVFVASLRGVVEELAAEVEALKSSLDCEQRRNEKLAIELAVARNNEGTDVNSNDSNNGMLELQNKLELILKSNAELVAEKEALLDKLRGQQQFISNLQMDGVGEELGSWMTNLDKQQNDLLAELRAYREQHTSLAELVGSTGVLQETLYRQKQELLHKFEGKTEIEKLLERERTELKSAHLKIQMMELQLLEKDKISQELARQKRLLEEDLHEIEDRLKDQEDQLESQKLALEAEIHARDLHIKHWQLELKRKQVEGSTEIAMKTLEQQTKNKETDEQQKLELLRSQLDDMHLQAVARLKHHLEEQFAVRETELQRNFSSELATLEQQHKEQLLDLQTKLDHKVKEIEKLLDTELMHQLGISNDMATRLQVEDMIHIKEQMEREVEELKNNLNAEHKEMYSIMRGKLEKYADQQIALAIKLLKEEHSTVQQQEINSLIIKHTEELKTLHLKLESQRQEELLALRQELNKKHKDDLNEATKGLKLEFAVLKEPFDRLSKENILQLKDKASVEYTVSINNCVQTWYTECQEHIENLNKQIEYVFEGQQNVEVQGDVEKLLETKEQYLTQVDDLQTEIAKHYVQSLQNLESLFDVEQAKLIGKIEEMKKTFEEGTTVASMQNQIKELEEEKEELNKKHRLAVDLLSQEKQLANLRDELEAKHAKEMEELRQYFEQKCLEVEKHYSEEVFSQQSRKMSGSSSETEELVSDMYYAGGDHGQRLTTLTHICDSYTVEPSYKDLEEHYRTDFEKRLLEYREQLDTVKVELEQKYNSEMELMREEYETKVAELVTDLSNTHKAEIQNLESKHAKEILNLKEKFQAEAAAELSTVKLECSQEIDKMRKEMAETHQEELMRLKNTYEEEMKLKIENLTKQMKQEEECHLEAMKSKLLNKHVRDIQNMEDTFADHVVEEIGKTTTDSALQKVDLEHKVQSDLKGLEEEHQKKIKEMEEKHAKDLEAERKLLGEQFDEIANMLKKSAQEEQEKFMLKQKEMMSELLKQHQKDFQVLKCQHEEKTHQMKGKYEHKIKLLKDELAKYIKNKDTCLVQPEYMAAASQVQFSACRNTSEDETIQQLKEEIKEKDAKLAELKTLHESELEQLRIHCDGQLHDEVEQAKHDIVRALEEQIQALLANDSEDSPRPPELVELQEKFAARYKQQLEELKERHTRELEHLKQESDSELQSLSEKYSLLEEQHQDYLDQEMALLTQKVELSFTNTGTFIDSTVRELRSLKRQIRELEKTKHAMQVKLGEATEEGEKDSITVLHADLEELIKERDGLKKMTDTLRYLLGELVAYFTVCEDELNNTLIGELLRCEAEISLDAADTSKNNSTLVDQAVPPIPQDVSGRNSEANSIKTGDTFSIESPLISPGEDISLVHEQAPHDNVSAAAQHLEKSLVTTSTNNSARRVHFAPDASGIISLIEGDRLMECIQKNKDVSTDFRCELENCLERLKHEAVTVLGLSGALPKTVQLTREAVAVLEDKVNILTKRLEEEVKTKDELLVQVDKAEEREKELVELQEHVDALELELRLARASIAELERELGKREDVSEGFGESIQPGLNKRLQNMAQLQDKARTVLSEKADDLQKSPHLQLIEELCHEGDRLSEEARKEREDLQQQVSLGCPSFLEMLCSEEIDAADKQLRATRQFLEDQAAEREQERDDFLREIAKLQEQIRERDRDRAEHQQLSKEVEVLEQQVKEAASLQKDSDAKKEELETELKAAVDKIWVLRDIIGELESQVETKTKHEELLEQQLRELHAILEQQSKNHQELAEELDSLRLDSGKSELTDHINHLEEQLRKHRLHVEQFQANSTAVKQMKAQLRDLEAAVDKKTKDLESLHTNVSSASCSSPSEDVSIREQLDALRCETPESQTQSPVCLPLDDLHRLQDKLQRHTRAEEVALKRIRDLEMQLKAVKRSEEEVTAERDVLQERMEEQLFKISTLQSRLDEQRLKTDSLQKEAYLELQAKVRDQEIEINKLREIVETKEKELQKAKSNMEKTKKIMAAHEQEWSMCSREVKEIKEKLRRICLEHNLDTSILQPHIIMPTYIANKEFVLRDQLGAPSKRVEGQLKRYASVMDRRIWSNDQEENRQYFLEYIRAMPDDQVDGSLGRIIPIEAVIELLMGKKDVMIDDLKSQLADCRDGKPEDLSGVNPEVRSGGPDPDGKLNITPGEDELLFTSDRNVGETESELDMDESNLKWMLVQKDSEILSLKHKLAACQIDLDDKDLYLIEAMKKLEHAYDIIEENRDILEELEKSNMKIKTLQGEKENLSKERKDAVALVQKLELENKDLKKKRGFATPESKKLQEELDSYRAKVKELENQEKDLLKGNESQMLLLEVENLKNTLGKYADLEKKLLELMKKASRCDEMMEKLRAAGIDPDFSGATSGEGLKGLSPGNQAKKIDELQKALDACKEQQEEMKERGVTFKNGSVPGGKSLDECLAELDKMRAALAGKTPSELLNELEQVRKDKKEQDAGCEALKKERDMLKRERDAVMEERNALRFQASQCISKLGALQAENAALKMELEQLRGQGGSCQVMEQKLNALRRERDASKQRVNELGSALQDLQHKNGNLSNVVAERDMLRMKLNDFAGLEQELERMRYRVKEAEVLRTERDRMKMRLDELECIEDAYHALLNETRNMEVISAERDLYKTKYEEIACLESEVECLKNCVGQLQRAECERDQLKRKVKDLQCAIADQEDENKHLRITLDHLSFGPEEQQARVEQGIAELRSELKEKEKKLSECECQLANLQIMQAEKEALEEKLRTSVMTTETVRKTYEEKCKCWEASEAELQRQLNENKQKLVKQNQEISTMQTDISKKDEMMKKLSKDRDDSLLQMANEVEALKAKIKGLQENVEELEGLRIELLDCKEENSKLMKDAEVLREKLMTVVEENKTLQEENATLTGSCSGVCLLTIEELTNENKNLKHDLACRNELLEKLKKECDEKDADVSKLNQHMSHLEVERNREQKLREHCTCQLAAVNAAKMKLEKKLECAEDSLASDKKWKVQLKVEQKEKMSNQAETGAVQESLKNELDEEKRIRRILENKLETLQNKFQTSKENVNDLHSHVEIAFQTRSALEIQLKSLNTELMGLKDELLQYREHCEQEKKDILKTFNIEQSCKSLQEKINQLKEGLEKADAEKSKLNEKLDTYEYQFTAQDDEIQHLCGKSEVLEDTARLESSQVAIEEINNLRQKSSELKPKNALLKEKLRKQRNSIEVSKSVSSVFVKEEFCCKKEKSSILPPKIEEPFSAQEGFSNDKEEKMVDDEGIPEETSCLRQQSNDKINSSSLFEDEVRNLRQKSSELQAENEELRNQLATQQEVTKNEIKFRSSRQNEINNLKLKSSELEMQNSKLKVKVAEQQKFIQKQEAENSENLLQWNESIDRLQKQVSEIKTSHDSLESQLQEKCKVKDKQEDIIQRMDREIKDLRVKLTEAQKLEYLLIDEQEKNKVKVNEISKMKIRNEELTAKLEELKTKHAGSSEELNNLRLESNASKMKLKDLSSYVKKVSEKNEELKSSLNEAEKKLSEMSHTVAALEKEREEFKICHESAYEDVKKCKQMIKELDREVKKLSNVSCPKCQAFLQGKKLQLESDQEFSELGRRLTENLDGAEHLNQENVEEINVKHEIEKDVISKHYTKSNERLLDLHAKDKNELTSRSELELYAGNFVNEIVVEGKQSVLEINLSKKLGKSMNHSAPKTNTEDKLDNELQRVKKSSNQKIRDLTNQVEQEIKKIKQNHVEEIQCLQAEHEKKLQKLNERFQNDRQRAASVGMDVERQIPDRRRLSCSKTEIYSFEPSKRPVPVEKRIDLTGPPKDGKVSKTNEIVSKVLQEGIMALDFEDLSYLHQQICSATCSALMKADPSKHGYNINQYECKCGLQVDDPVLLQKRICSLEDEIAQKEKENERQVLQLESSIRRERRHIEDLKEKLSMEQQKTMELHNRLKLHSRGLSDVQVERDLYQKQLAFHEDRVREFIVMLEQERARVRQYEDEIAKERNNVKNLQSLLDAERHRARCAKLQDSEFIENLRIKLETAMANENKLRLQIEQEKLVRDTAEKLGECTSPKGRCPAFPSNGKLELEQERCAKLELELRREQRRAEELVSAVEKERQLGLQKIEIEKELVHQLKRELLSLEGQRESLNSQLMHVREQLGVRSVETEALERKVRVLQEAEVRRQRKRLSEQEELDKNRRALQKAQSLQYDLEQKIIDLEQEVARLRQQLLDRKLHASGEILRQEVEKLKLDLEESIRERSPSPKLSSPVLEKLKNVNVMLEQHVSENAEVALTLSRLTEERQQLQSRIRDLEAKLRAASKERGADELVSTERALWAQEKAALKVALAQAEADALRGGCRTGDGTDMEERVKHLYGKFLRAESYRKALVWQKRYLLVVLGGYQESEAITVSRLAQLSGIQEAMVHHTHSSSVSHRKPRTRFRTAAIVVIALSRMRFMVRRWRLGRRIGSGAVLSRGYSESALSSTQSSYHGPRRRGSSTSMHSLAGLRGPTHANNRFGLLSPPSRDQPTVRRWQTDFVVQHHMRSTENIPVTSIRPSHVSEYVDRLDELQRRLGLGISSPPS